MFQNALSCDAKPPRDQSTPATSTGTPFPVKKASLFATSLLAVSPYSYWTPPAPSGRAGAKAGMWQPPRHRDPAAASPRSSPLGQRVLLHGRVGAEAVLGEEVLAVLPNELVYALPPPLGMPVAVALQNQRPAKQTTRRAGC